MHTRLRSRHAEKPENPKPLDRAKKPLNEQLQGLILYVKTEQKSAALKRSLVALSAVFQCADHCIQGSTEERHVLKEAAKQSHSFCALEGRTLQQTVDFYGFPPGVINNKTIKEVNKIGRYWGLCEDLVQASRRYGTLFELIELACLPHYTEVKAAIASKLITIPCYVHTEIQLLVHYGRRFDANTFQPRVIGVSKAACYLCNLFILFHKQFFFSKTHGKLYPIWNVPDLAEYPQSQRLAIRRILKKIDKEIQKDLKRPLVRREDPMESSIDLPPKFLPLRGGSDLETIGSEVASDTPRPLSRMDKLPQPDPPNYAESPVTIPENLQMNGTHKSASSLASPEVPIPPAVKDSAASSDPVKDHISPRPPSLPPSPAAIEMNQAPNPPKDSVILAQQIITASSPLQVQAGLLGMTFEIEGPAQGDIMVEKVAQDGVSNAHNTIDTSIMTIGKDYQYERPNGSDRLILRLSHPDGTLVQLTNQWVQ